MNYFQLLNHNQMVNLLHNEIANNKIMKNNPNAAIIFRVIFSHIVSHLTILDLS